MKRERIPIAREGVPFIGYLAFLALVAAVLGYQFTSLLLVAITTFVLLFFRDPERLTPAVERGVIAPADGKVIRVEKTVDERFAEDQVLKISIFMNVFNVHVNRVPFSGTVSGVTHMAGSFLAADSDKAHLLNEYCAVALDVGNNRRITVVQVAGLIARRIVCRLEPGDRVSAGERFGLIRFGSRVDLYLPKESHPVVTVGDKVTAGESLLAYIG
ncbi:MAG: phosphatidylserine decarboxylase family protein [Desulfofustis sp.]|nr:phosphatidylserine decarboxylase family protein [Desulfofustis sp.]